MMRVLQQQVADFQRKFNCTIRTKPEIPDDWLVEFRQMLITEEYKELRKAMQLGNMTEIADGICDLIYVLVGTAIAYGMDLQPIWDEVHRSNMEKEPVGECGDGTKPRKPAGWRKPRIAEELDRQRGNKTDA